jgi:hypothetical protein
MNTPDKCPKCGSNVSFLGAGVTYFCGTWVPFNDDSIVAQSRECAYSQRDQLLQKVQRLEKAGDAMQPSQIGACECEAGSVSYCGRCFDLERAWNKAKEI